MERQSESQKASLQEAVSLFYGQMPDSPAMEYLTERGLYGGDLQDQVERYRLGYVGDPLPGFEKYQGMLAIPYLRHRPHLGSEGWGCVSIRFRQLADIKPKYRTMPGDRPRLYNTPALNLNVRDVGITEGELDAISASICGLPTVGVPGAQSWRPHWAELFRGYRTVFVFTDGDGPGDQFGETVGSSLSNSKIIPCPPGEDVNSLLVSGGVAAVRERYQ